MFALADCNNFFASCERVFRPDLQGKPLIVLSSNDGCAIARSNEAKALGIKMGDPLFKIKDIVQKHNVAVFSGNMALYGDMSQRVRWVLQEYAPAIEVYSIDEAFLDLRGMENIDFDVFAKRLSAQCWKWYPSRSLSELPQRRRLQRLHQNYVSNIQNSKGDATCTARKT
jgi:DNA polymerase V